MINFYFLKIFFIFFKYIVSLLMFQIKKLNEFQNKIEEFYQSFNHEMTVKVKNLNNLTNNNKKIII